MYLTYKSDDPDIKAIESISDSEPMDTSGERGKADLSDSENSRSHYGGDSKGNSKDADGGGGGGKGQKGSESNSSHNNSKRKFKKNFLKFNFLEEKFF